MSADQINNEFYEYRLKKYSQKSQMFKEFAAQSLYVVIFTVNFMI